MACRRRSSTWCPRGVSRYTRAAFDRFGARCFDIPRAPRFGAMLPGDRKVKRREDPIGIGDGAARRRDVVAADAGAQGDGGG